MSVNVKLITGEEIGVKLVEGEKIGVNLGTLHNSLFGLQGGSETERFHLTESEVDLIHQNTGDIATISGLLNNDQLTDIVFQTGDQTISGIKSFDEDVVFNADINSAGNINQTGNYNISGDVSINGGINTVDSIQFNTSAGVTVGQGEIAWNSEDLTLDLGIDNVTLQVGQEQVLRVKCADSLGVYDGMPVYAYDTIGGSDNIEIKRFSAADDFVDELYFLGIATEDIAENGVGFVTTFGKVREVDGRAYGTGQGVKDPADTSDWEFGNVLYVSPNVAGTLTKVIPTAPNKRIPVAMVLKAPNQHNITLMVRAEHGYHLDEIHDVYSSSLTDGQALIYNQANKRWENKTLNLAYLPLGGGTLDGSLNVNGDLSVDGSVLHVDSTNNRVGIGTTTPTSKLHIEGSGDTDATSSLNVTDSVTNSLLFVRDDGNVGIGTDNPQYEITLIASSPTIGGYTVQSTSGSETAHFSFRSLNFSTTNPSIIAGRNLFFHIGGSSSKTSGHGFTFRPNDTRQSLSSSTSEQGFIKLEPLIEQSGTANYVGLLMDVTETSTGSNQNYLADFRVGGTSKFNVTREGSVGVGTTSPTEKLHIENGNLLIKPNAVSSTHSGLLLGINKYNSGKAGLWGATDGAANNTDGNLYISTRNVSAVNGSYIQLGQRASTTSTDKGSIFIQAGRYNSHGQTGDIFLRYGGGSDSLTLKGSSGNVGIGTSTPSSKLDIRNGTSPSELRIYGTDDGAGNTAFASLTHNSSGDLTISTEQTGTGTSGNIILNPKGADGNGGKIIIDGDQFTNSLEILNNGILSFGSGSAYRFALNSTENSYIKSWSKPFEVFGSVGYVLHVDCATTGNIGIGTRTPARKLHVSDAMRLEPTTTPASPSAGDIYFDSFTNKLRCYDGTAWNDLF